MLAKNEHLLVGRVRSIIRTWTTTFTLDQVYALADAEAHKFPLHENVEARHGVMRRALQDERPHAGLIFIRNGLYKYPQPAKDCGDPLECQTPQRKEIAMLDTAHETALGAAFKKASVKADPLADLRAALVKAKPLLPTAPVLTLAMLDEFLRATADSQRSEDVTVIPEMAQYIMDTYPWEENRPLDEKRVTRYQGFICESDWSLDGTPVKINDRRQLHNGRHRFTACVRAGRPFATTMRFGVPWQTFKTEDTGKPWVANDVFRLDGWKYYQSIAHIVRRIEYYRNGVFDSRDTDASNNDRVQQARALGKRKLERAAEVGSTVRAAMASRKRKVEDRFKVQPQYIAQAYYLAAENNKDEAEKFFGAWAESPTKLHNIAAEMIHTALKPRDTVGCAVAILAWNQYRKNPKASVAEIRQALHWELGYPTPTVAA